MTDATEQTQHCPKCDASVEMTEPVVRCPSCAHIFHWPVFKGCPVLPFDDPNFDVDRVRSHWEAVERISKTRVEELRFDLDFATQRLRDAEAHLSVIRRKIGK